MVRSLFCVCILGGVLGRWNGEISAVQPDREPAQIRQMASLDAVLRLPELQMTGTVVRDNAMVPERLMPAAIHFDRLHHLSGDVTPGGRIPPAAAWRLAWANLAKTAHVGTTVDVGLAVISGSSVDA